MKQRGEMNLVLLKSNALLVQEVISEGQRHPLWKINRTLWSIWKLFELRNKLHYISAVGFRNIIFYVCYFLLFRSYLRLVYKELHADRETGCCQQAGAMLPAGSIALVCCGRYLKGAAPYLIRDLAKQNVVCYTLCRYWLYVFPMSGSLEIFYGFVSRAIL